MVLAKAVTRSKRMGKKKPLLHVRYGLFNGLNKADLKFLSDVFVEKGKGLLEKMRNSTGGGSFILWKPWSFRRDDVLRTP